ncbi:MAG TPA: isoprenylcysteine carboxylmethyltransferase family protein [Pyrinomonadaceae bacterium]
MPSKSILFLQRNRVFLGFIISLAYLIFSRPSPAPLSVGVAVASLGLLLRAWACGHLRKTLELDVSGPYAHTRNPLYLGTFIIAIGFGIASGSWWLFLLVVTYIGSIYFPVMNVEADVLRQRLGQEYEEYEANVPLLIPRLTPWKKSDRTFDFQLYLKNGEYNAAIGLAVATAILVAKIYAPNFL